MTLTLPNAPLASHGPRTVNYRIDGPQHRLLFDPFPRRVRAVLGGEQVLDTSRGMLLHESNLLPQLYVPRADVRTDLLSPTDHSTHCPFKGDAAYWSVTVGDRTAENAVWGYPQPIDAAGWLDGYLAFYWGAMDAWFDEDQPVFGHLRDPYTRLDVVPTSRNVVVRGHGEVLVDTRAAVVLSETSLPNRYYVPAAEVPAGLLESSDTHTVCPYKGTATYRTVHTAGGAVADGAWFYPEPFEGVHGIRDHLCFLGEGIETLVDGEPVG